MIKIIKNKESFIKEYVDQFKNNMLSDPDDSDSDSDRIFKLINKINDELNGFIHIDKLDIIKEVYSQCNKLISDDIDEKIEFEKEQEKIKNINEKIDKLRVEEKPYELETPIEEKKNLIIEGNINKNSKEKLKNHINENKFNKHLEDKKIESKSKIIILIDGSNIAYGSHKRKNIAVIKNIENVKKLIKNEMKKYNKKDFYIKIYCDASLRHNINNKNQYESLLKEPYSGYIQTPSNQEADPTIITDFIKNIKNSPDKLPIIISNDRYKEFLNSEKYLKKIPGFDKKTVEIIKERKIGITFDYKNKDEDEAQIDWFKFSELINKSNKNKN